MAACTTCLDKLLVGLGVPEEMAGETDVFVNTEMLIALEMTMTNTTCDINSIDLFFHVILVSEFDTVEVDILCQ